MRTVAEIQARLEPLVKKYGLTLLVLFGSQATGTTHAHSDVDIAYSAQPQLSLTNECGLIVDLMPVCGAEHIDLSSLARAPALLMKEIALTGIPLHESLDTPFSDFIVRAIHEYEETKPLFLARSQYVAYRAEIYRRELAHV